MQPKKWSLFEAFCNSLSGIFISWLVTLFILPPMLDVEIAADDALVVTLMYTVISVARSYIWRRLFNRKRHAK